MVDRIARLKGNRTVNWVVKIVICAFIIAWFGNCLYINKFNTSYSYRNYAYQNAVTDTITGNGITSISQKFISKGNILSSVSLYLGEVGDSDISVSLLDENGRGIFSTIINLKDWSANTWNTISVDCNKVERDRTYSLLLEGDDLSSIVLNNGNSDSKIFETCFLDGAESKYTLAVGMQVVYKYVILGYGLQGFISCLIVVGLCWALCFSVINIEKLYFSFIETRRDGKEFWYALYFAVYTVLLFNPLDSIRNEVVAFSRVMGAGFNDGVDVSKRISNFSHWFIYFAIAFVMYFMLTNYLRNRTYTGCNKRMVSFMDDIIVIANVALGLRCITFFYNECQETNIFYYTDYFFILILSITIGYVVLGFDKIIDVNKFMILHISAWLLCLPVSIVITHEWADGRTFAGLQYILSALIFIGCIIMRNYLRNREYDRYPIELCVMCFSFIPFITSLYIELIAVLNQRKIFLTHIRRDYCLVIALLVIIMVAISILFVRKEKQRGVMDWKKITYPALVLGFSFLWQQIPISAEYGADIFETANSSVLINDFLQFGDIPIVQHYGGHMMSGVWEGIVYALINNDFKGAVLSPYAGYIAVPIALAFFYFIKNIWNEDAAILVTLFFPFYGAISYWGLGLMTVLAAMYYIKSNTFKRAILFWGICIWCTLYRLDLGVAFILACMTAFAIYIIVERNKVALKQLVLSLVAWGIIGITIWFVVCFIKGINPVYRLLEFIHLSLSNQNWAYSSIGDVSVTKFAFAYIILPFTMVLLLVSVVFSEKIKRNIDKDIWVALLILGFSYFYNFSRGLSRHSLAEDTLYICTWSAYLCMAFFAVVKVNNKKLFLPVFTVCILLATLFQTDSNYSEKSIIDSSIAKIGTYSETWTLDQFAWEDAADGETASTYWTQLRENQEIIERVKWTSDIKSEVRGYQMVIDALLDADETFVDMINKTTVYSLINKEDPVYISQSPLQLSGQFTQEQFIEEIDGVPVVMMPCDTVDNRSSESLDGVANAYRYYKAFEYIYQNYVPLCSYENQFAIWCLPDKYDELSKKIKQLRREDDIESTLLVADLPINSLEKVDNLDGTFNLNYTGEDPTIWDLQSYFDITPYIDGNLTVEIDYESDVLGDMQIFYTSDENEDFSGNKVETYTCSENEGTARFVIPVTEFTRLRFDTPERSNVKIESFRLVACDVSLIDYGYDGPYLQNDGITYSYLPAVHNYDLGKLPVIWGECDKLNSAENTVMSTLSFQDGYYEYSLNKDELGLNGNYLKVNIACAETTTATLTVGEINNGNFETKYLYNFTVKEGEHTYMFRVSNDYYWYIEETNAIKIEPGSQLLDVNMQILEGD